MLAINIWLTRNTITLEINQNLSTMSKYDYINGKWTFHATPLDYLHCIFNEYEWLILLKGRNKPYEEFLDPLYDIARKERYEDEELADINHHEVVGRTSQS